MAKMKNFTDREMADFCGQLAMILDAGMSLSEGLYMMAEDCHVPEEQQILSLLQEGMDRTGSFSESLKEAGIFPAYMVQTVRLGEQTGHADDVMAALQIHYDREDSIKKSIRSAVSYPLMMLFMMILVIVVLLTQVLPIFNQVFMQLGSELTGISRGLLNLGTGIRQYAPLILVAVALLAVGGFTAARLSRRNPYAGKLARILPPLRLIDDKIALCRFSSGMALALSSGLGPENALDLVRELSPDRRMQSRLDLCREQMDAGQGLSQSLIRCGIYSGLQAKMVTISERTGTLDQAMNRIARECQEDADQKIADLLSLIEPSLVVLLSLFVGVILMSVMFPLLGIMSGI